MISLPGLARSSLAVTPMRGGTMPSSRIYRVPPAQHICSFCVLRWCPRPGNKNMPCDGTPPGPGRSTAAGAWPVAIADGDGPCSTRVVMCFHTSTHGRDRLSRSAPGHPLRICCDLRSCPFAPAGLPIRHLLPSGALVPGVTGNTNRHIAGMHRFPSLRSSYRCHCPGPDNVGPLPQHHRRANHRDHF